MCSNVDLGQEKEVRLLQEFLAELDLTGVDKMFGRGEIGPRNLIKEVECKVSVGRRPVSSGEEFLSLGSKYTAT